MKDTELLARFVNQGLAITAIGCGCLPMTLLLLFALFILALVAA